MYKSIQTKLRSTRPNTFAGLFTQHYHMYYVLTIISIVHFFNLSYRQHRNIVTFLIWCLLCWFIHIPFTKSISLSKKCHWHFQGSVLAAWHALVNSYLAVAGVLLYQLFKTSSERVLKVLNCRWMLVNSLRVGLKRCNLEKHLVNQNIQQVSLEDSNC